MGMGMRMGIGSRMRGGVMAVVVVLLLVFLANVSQLELSTYQSSLHAHMHHEILLDVGPCQIEKERVRYGADVLIAGSGTQAAGTYWYVLDSSALSVPPSTLYISGLATRGN
jgi:hypothetical protein